MLRKTQQMPREIFLVFNLLALFIITYFLVDSFYGVINMRLNETGESKVDTHMAADMPPDQQVLSHPGYEMIAQRNIFGATGKDEMGVVEEKMEQVEMLQETSLALSLLGTIAGDTDSARAIILDQRLRSQDIYRVGDSVQEAVIRQILRGKIVLRQGEKDEVLSMTGAEDIFNVARDEQRSRPYMPARAVNQAASAGQGGRPYMPARAVNQTASAGQRSMPYIPSRARSQAASAEQRVRAYIPARARSQAVPSEEVTAEKVYGIENEKLKQEVGGSEAEPLTEASIPEEQIAAAPESPVEETISGTETQAPEIPASEVIAKVQEPPPGMTAAQLPGFTAIEPFVASWATAWKQKNIDTYLSHYSKDFITPGGMSREAWEKQRYDRLGSPEFIRIDIRDIHKQKVNNSRVQVIFIQEYESNSYSDKVLKVLDLVWEDGAWLIAKETSMPAAKQLPPAVATIEEVREVEAPVAGAADLTAVEPFVASWVEAWKQKTIEAYLSHYSKNYSTPGGMSRGAWEKQRDQRLDRPQYIKIDIREMQKQKLDDSRAQVAFIQEYQSDIYSDKVLKTLELMWESGGWKIVKETSSAL